MRDLSERGISSPEHIGLQGGSNGGLITAAAFVREPQSIGALVCEVPLTDMIRYPLLSAGSAGQTNTAIRKIRSLQTPVGRIVAVSQSFRRHRLSARAHYHQPLRRSRPSRPRAQVLRQTARNLRAILALLPDGGGHTKNGTQRESADELACILLFLKEFLG